MQKFVAQPTEPGHLLQYCVARITPQHDNPVPIRGEEYATLKEAETRAFELNQEQEEK